MISEVENIKKGLVVSTSDFDNNKKIIGVNNDNITPDENGICPLGKQGAFIKEEPIETFEEVSALDTLSSVSNNVEETLDFAPKPAAPAPTPVDGAPVPMSSFTPTQVPTEDPTKMEGTPKFILPAATVSDTTMESPVEVAPTDTLNTLIVETPAPIEEASKPEEETEAVVELQMPVMDEEVLASEPTGVDNSLFETGEPSQSTLDEPKPEPVAAVSLEQPSAGSVGGTNSNEMVVKLLDELSAKLTEHIKADIEEFKNKLNSATLDKGPEPTQSNEAGEPNVEDIMNGVPGLESSVMSDAINQINNMVIPGSEGPRL